MKHSNDHIWIGIGIVGGVGWIMNQFEWMWFIAVGLVLIGICYAVYQVKTKEQPPSD